MIVIDTDLEMGELHEEATLWQPTSSVHRYYMTFRVLFKADTAGVSFICSAPILLVMLEMFDPKLHMFTIQHILVAQRPLTASRHGTPRRSFQQASLLALR